MSMTLFGIVFAVGLLIVLIAALRVQPFIAFIVSSIAAALLLGYRARLPAVSLGVPMLAGLSIAHGFLPPHPSPTALVTQFGADMGLTLFYGCLVGIPTMLIVGPLIARSVRNIVAQPSELFKPTELTDDQLPGAFNSFVCALLPVLLIGSPTRT